MRLLGGILLMFLILTSCRKSLLHERWVVNSSSDSVFVLNPDFDDTVYSIAPASSAMIYSYEILDTDQESEECQWLGDTLYIQNALDSVCSKAVSLESNWTTEVTTGEKKKRKQVCRFTVRDEDFD